MVRAVVVPAHAGLPVYERQIESLADYQDAVGGYVEPLVLETAAITLWVDEEGKVKHRPPNARATFLFWFLDSAVHREDVLAGDVVLTVDGPDERAESLLDEIARGRRCRVEVTHASAPDKWIPIRVKFDDWFEAARAAIWIQIDLESLSAIRIKPL